MHICVGCISDVEAVMYDVWCMMCDVWCTGYYVWCMMHYVRCIVYDVWCMMFVTRLWCVCDACMMCVYDVCVCVCVMCVYLWMKVWKHPFMLLHEIKHSSLRVCDQLCLFFYLIQYLHTHTNWILLQIKPLSVSISLCLSLFLSLCLSLFLSLSLYIYISLPLSLSLCISVSLYFCLSLSRTLSSLAQSNSSYRRISNKYILLDAISPFSPLHSPLYITVFVCLSHRLRVCVCVCLLWTRNFSSGKQHNGGYVNRKAVCLKFRAHAHTAVHFTYTHEPLSLSLSLSVCLSILSLSLSPYLILCVFVYILNNVLYVHQNKVCVWDRALRDAVCPRRHCRVRSHSPANTWRLYVRYSHSNQSTRRRCICTVAGYA